MRPLAAPSRVRPPAASSGPGPRAVSSRVLVTVGAVVLVLGTFLPWVASGTAERNSYDLTAIVGRLGFSTSGPFELALTLWALVPLCSAAAVTAVWWGWRIVGAVAGALASVYAGAVAASVLLAPQVGLVRVLVGVPVTLAGVVVLLAGSVATAWSTGDDRLRTATGS